MAVHSNTLTNLIPQINQAIDIVSRELTGAIPAVTIFAGSEGVAKDQTVRIPQTAVMAAEAITPAADIPDTGQQTIGYTDMKLDQAYAVPFSWTGEEQQGMTSVYGSVFQQQVAQAIRTLNNQIEADIMKQYKSACRAHGTSGTTPFAASLEDAAYIKQILDDNGAGGDRSLIIDSTAGVNLRKLANLSTANAAGTDATLRQGTLLSLFGMDIRESAQVQKHVKGTMTGADCTAVEPVGETVIAVDGSDSGTILAGDVITNTTRADGHKYVVVSATASGAADGNITIQPNGLRTASVVADEWVIQNDYRANMAFSRSAVVLGIRPPKRPMGGDRAIDVTFVTDPLTGITYSIAVYPTYMGVRYQVEAVWGVVIPRPEHCALLLG